MEMQRVSAHWFQLTGDPWVEVVDKWSGGNVHPDRVMNQWVLVLMLRGQRTFRVYGEDYAVRAGDFFLLPPLCAALRHRVRRARGLFRPLSR